MIKLAFLNGMVLKTLKGSIQVFILKTGTVKQ
jgi:hypothetical protein